MKLLATIALLVSLTAAAQEAAAHASLVADDETDKRALNEVQIMALLCAQIAPQRVQMLVEEPGGSLSK